MTFHIMNTPHAREQNCHYPETCRLVPDTVQAHPLLKARFGHS